MAHKRSVEACRRYEFPSLWAPQVYQVFELLIINFFILLAFSFGTYVLFNGKPISRIELAHLGNDVIDVAMALDNVDKANTSSAHVDTNRAAAGSPSNAHFASPESCDEFSALLGSFHNPWDLFFVLSNGMISGDNHAGTTARQGQPGGGYKRPSPPSRCGALGALSEPRTTKCMN